MCTDDSGLIISLVYRGGRATALWLPKLVMGDMLVEFIDSTFYILFGFAEGKQCFVR